MNESNKDEKQDLWDRAYKRGGNMLFYPHEEIVRFLNRYVRKRVDYNEFRDILALSEKEWRGFRSLDFGCGCGRHVNLLDDFSLNPTGIDISDIAIETGKKWFASIGKERLCDRLVVGDVCNLPFEDQMFDIIVSHSVLDCMPRELGIQGMKEAKRVLKTGGMMCMDFRIDIHGIDHDWVRKGVFDEGTTWTGFTEDSLREYLGEDVDIVEWKTITLEEDAEVIGKRAHLIMKKRYTT